MSGHPVLVPREEDLGGFNLALPPARDAGNLVAIMNSNPRSLPRQQYFFSTEATYSLHVGRQSDPNNDVTGVDNLRFDFTFGEPDTNGQQTFTMNIVTLDGSGAALSQATSTGLTTPAPALLGNPNPTIVNNDFTINGANITVFAGLREDPFFFDVEQFFKVRAAVAGFGPAASFFGPDDATDFAAGYNVNSIVVRVPISFLQASGETTFDVWESISIPNDLAARQ